MLWNCNTTLKSYSCIRTKTFSNKSILGCTNCCWFLRFWGFWLLYLSYLYMKKVAIQFIVFPHVIYVSLIKYVFFVLIAVVRNISLTVNTYQIHPARKICFFAIWFFLMYCKFVSNNKTIRYDIFNVRQAGNSVTILNRKIEKSGKVKLLNLFWVKITQVEKYCILRYGLCI